MRAVALRRTYKRAYAYVLGLSQRCRSGHRPVDWLNKDDKSALTRELRNGARGHVPDEERETSCAGARGTPDNQRVSAREKNTIGALL